MCALPSSGVAPARPTRPAGCAKCTAAGPFGGGACTCGGRAGQPGQPPRFQARPGAPPHHNTVGPTPPVSTPRRDPSPAAPPAETRTPSTTPATVPNQRVPDRDAPGNGGAPPRTETVPSKNPEEPQTTIVLTRQPPAPPRVAPRVDFGVSLPFVPPPRPQPKAPAVPPVDLGTSIPLVLPAPPATTLPPGYCDDPRFANTELCYKGGVPASQGRGPMAVIEKGNPEIKGASVVERVPGVLNVPNLNFKGAAGPSKMGFLAGQYAPSYSAPQQKLPQGFFGGGAPYAEVHFTSMPAGYRLTVDGVAYDPTNNVLPITPGLHEFAVYGNGEQRSLRINIPGGRATIDWNFMARSDVASDTERYTFEQLTPSPVVRVADIVPSLKGGVPASQGRPPLSVPVPVGFQVSMPVASPPRSEKSIAKSAGALYGLDSGGYSRPVVGATVVQTAPARGANPAGDGLPVSQFMPSRHRAPPTGIVGIPVAQFRATQGPSVAQYRPAGLGLTYEQAITAEQCAGISGTWDAANRRCTPSEASDPSKPGGPDHTDAILGAVSTGLGALGQTITRILELENQRIQGRLTAEGNQAIELERIRAQRDLANAQSALNDARSQGANDSALQALSAQLAALQAQAQNAGVQVGMSTPAKIGLAVGGVAIVGGFAYLLARNAGGARSNPSRGSARSSRASRRNGRAGSRRGRR